MSVVPLIIRGVDQASGALKRVGASVGEVNKKLDMGNKLAGAFKTGMIAAAGAIATAFVASAKAAIDFESAMADVAKVVGRANVDAHNLDSTIIRLTRTLPNSASELATIAAAGGQLGIAAEDLADFTELAAKMGVAYNMSAEDAGQAMATLSNVFGVPITEMEAFGDQINELGNRTNASAASIVNALVRVGGVTRTFGLATNEAAALVDAFIAIGAPPEVAATAIAGILPRLQNATLQTDAFKDGLARVGLTAEQMEANIAEGPLDAFQDLLNRLQSLSSDERSKALGMMFMQGADSRLMATLANDATKLSDAYAIVADQSAIAGSMQREFATRAATTGNAFQLLRNAFNEVLIRIGTDILPVIGSTLGVLTGMVHRFADFLDQNPLAEIPERLGLDFSSIQGAVDSSIKLLSMAIAHIKPLLSEAVGRIGERIPRLIFDISNAIPPLLRRIGRAIPTMLNNINWEEIRTALLSVLRASSNGFVNMVNNVMPIVRRVIADVDWHSLGVQIGVVGGRIVGMAANALTKIDWGLVVVTVLEAGVKIARFFAGAIGGFALGVLPGLGVSLLNILGGTVKVAIVAIRTGASALINAVVAGIRAIFRHVVNTASNVLNPLRIPRQLFSMATNALGNVVESANSGPAVNLSASTAPAPVNFAHTPEIAPVVGSRATGQIGDLLNAAALETRLKPPGSDLVVANTAETILPPQAVMATLPPLPVSASPAPARSSANVSITINGAGQNAKAIAREVIREIQGVFEMEMQGRLA